MKNSVILFTFSLLVFSCQNESSESNANQDEITTLKPDELQGFIENGNYQLLDVRTAQEWEEEGLISQSAITIDVLKDGFEEEAKERLDLSKPVVVYCKVGQRSLKAAQMLDSLGFEEVYHLEGGMDAWKGAGYTPKE